MTSRLKRAVKYVRRILNPDALVPLLRWIGWPAIGIYVVSMVALPMILADSPWWGSVQAVWDRWQGLNVGMLALIASVIAFEVTRYKEDKQRARDFLAARSFLPDALSELCGYLEACAAVYMSRWNNMPLGAAPHAPSQYRGPFADCIQHADPTTGERLSSVVRWLQILDARISEFIANPPATDALTRLECIDGLCLVGELYARVNRLFIFARDEGPLKSSPLTWDDYHTAYRNLGVRVEDLIISDAVSLEIVTRRRIAKNRG